MITLTKNIFSYNEDIPFIIDIDCSKLSISIKSLKISIYRNLKKCHKKEPKKVRSERIIEIIHKQ